MISNIDTLWRGSKQKRFMSFECQHFMPYFSLMHSYQISIRRKRKMHSKLFLCMTALFTIEMYVLVAKIGLILMAHISVPQLGISLFQRENSIFFPFVEKDYLAQNRNME